MSLSPKQYETLKAIAAEARPLHRKDLYQMGLNMGSVKSLETRALVRREGFNYVVTGFGHQALESGAPQEAKDERYECQICAGMWKAKKDGTLVNHGYQRPGWGYIVGNCFGVGHQPFPSVTAIDKAIQYATEAREDQLNLAQTTETFPLKTGTRYVGRRAQDILEWVSSPREWFDVSKRNRIERFGLEYTEYEARNAEEAYKVRLARQRAKHQAWADQATRDIAFWTARKEEGLRLQQEGK